MAIPSSRNSFKAYCLRQLGHPVIRINVDDDQIEDAIDNALQYWHTFHSDSFIRTYLRHEVSADDRTNGYIDIDSNITGIQRIFPLTSGQMSSGHLFDANYQIRLNDIYGATAPSIIHYDMTMKHLALLNFEFSTKPRIEFTRHTDRLYISNWEEIPVGMFLIVEAFLPLDPDEFPKIWNDMFLKKYATALIKRQWGVNLKKFAGVPLLGGATMDGQTIYSEALDEIQKLEEEMRSTWEEPLDFLMG